MQINIDKKTGILLGIIGILAIALVAIAVPKFIDGSDNRGMGMSHDGHGSSMMENSKDSQPGNEVMFYQMMIPHHQQAVDISQLALEKSKNPELLKLAQDIYDGQSSEIKLMNKWLADGGHSSDMGHSMDDQMGGMLSDAELAMLKTKSGSAFDIYWLQKMIAHHEGALHMVMMIEDSSNPRVQRFASDIDSVQSAQISQMEKMLKKLGA
jgi:uncharacterized protein (DUF305 family)